MVFRRHCKAENRIAQLSSTTSPGYKKSPTGKLSFSNLPIGEFKYLGSETEQLPLLLPIFREIIYCLCQRHFRRRFALHDGDYYIRGQIDQRQGSGNVGAIQLQRLCQFQNGAVPAGFKHLCVLVRQQRKVPCAVFLSVITAFKTEILYW